MAKSGQYNSVGSRETNGARVPQLPTRLIIQILVLTSLVLEAAQRGRVASISFALGGWFPRAPAESLLILIAPRGRGGAREARLNNIQGDATWPTEQG